MQGKNAETEWKLYQAWRVNYTSTCISQLCFVFQWKKETGPRRRR